MPTRKPKARRKNHREQGRRYIVTEVFHLVRVILPIILDDLLR
jgi:hypothetical protein